MSRNLRARRARSNGNADSPRLPTRARDIGTVPLIVRRLTPIVRFGYPIGISVGPAHARVVATVDCFQMLKFTAGLVLALARSPFACVGLVYGLQHIHGLVTRARERAAREEEKRRRLDAVVEHAAPELEPIHALPKRVPICGESSREHERVEENVVDDEECASECSEWSVISELTASTVVISAQQDDAR